MAPSMMTEPPITVLRPGPSTTVQDWPGRIGYWQVGVPPSGPMDDLSLRLANLAVGNAEGAPGLEATMAGPTLGFDEATVVCVTGAPVSVTLDGVPARQWAPIAVPEGGVLEIGAVQGVGMRIYIAVAGGIEAEAYLGSRSTFTLGKFGAGGRALAAGDRLDLGAAVGRPRRLTDEEVPSIGHEWRLAVTEGPHGAPEFFTRADIETLYEATYLVDHNLDRTGVRLVGPKPQWARPDGGEAGLHPSNIHDTPYSVGALDFTGDTPILLGPDGPSLGGFVCPVTVTSADRWKLGQLTPGDRVRFVPVRASAAAPLAALGMSRRAASPVVRSPRGDGDDGVLHRGVTGDGTTSMTLRRSGDDNLLVEYGTMTLDLVLRARVHALHTAIEAHRPRGIIDLTPGIRSLQVKFDAALTDHQTMTAFVLDIESALGPVDQLVLPSRSVRLPLSWDDPTIRLAIDRYRNGVRDDAPWCPSNIEFIRRMNGLQTQQDVFDIVHAASYLVLGLGDVYLGAPVATPVDPRHRVVTTKYNPARTWTPENAVGIGGAYLCIYGMEGPGGYQLMGRTTQVWNHRFPLSAPGFEPQHPWLLRFFDQVSWYPVSSEELSDLRADVAAGRGTVDITDGEFRIADYLDFLSREAGDIAAVRQRMTTARGEERARWEASGEIGARKKPCATKGQEVA